MSIMPTLYRWMSPVAQAVSRARHGLTLGVRVLARDGEGRIALVRHTYLDGWYLPGGGVEPGEAAEAAARRELAEETGARADGMFEVFGVYTNFHQFPGNHIVLFGVSDVTPGPRAPDMEIAEIGWFARDDLPRAATPATRRRLEEVFHGRERASCWREPSDAPYLG